MFGSEGLNDVLFGAEQCRWKQVEAFYHERTDVLDSRISPLLFRLNTIDGLVTMWSCSGHPDREGDDGAGYIMIALRDDAREKNVRLLEAICDKAFAHSKALNLPSRFFIRLSRTYRMVPYLTDKVTLLVYNLGFQYQDMEEQKAIIQMLDYAIEETLDPQWHLKTSVSF